MTVAVPGDRFDASTPPPAVETPTVFVRTISAPPGLPWDQARMADLEARAGAPLPLAEVVYQVRRLEPWRPGRPARYSACYVRARDVGERLEATAVIDGKPVAVEFLSQCERTRRVRRLGAIAAITAVTALLVLGAVTSAVTLRSTNTERARQIQLAIEGRTRQARAIAELKAQTRALNGVHVRGESIADFLNDVAWASRSKGQGAHIDALHWDRRYMAVEARGDTAPFGQTDRAVIKTPKPLRPGVWLWGVAPAGEAAP